jgi:hypothetical protein
VSGEDFVAENGNWKVEIGKRRRTAEVWAAQQKADSSLRSE